MIKESTVFLKLRTMRSRVTTKSKYGRKKYKAKLRLVRIKRSSLQLKMRQLSKHVTMEVEYSGGGALIFSYFILIHQLDNFGGLRVTKLSRGSLMRVSSLAAALMAHQ